MSIHAKINDSRPLLSASRKGLLPEEPSTQLAKVYFNSIRPHVYSPNLRAFDVTIAKHPYHFDRGPMQFTFSVIANSFTQAAHAAVDRANAWRDTYLAAHELGYASDSEMMTIELFTPADVKKMDVVRDQVTVFRHDGASDAQLKLYTTEESHDPA